MQNYPIIRGAYVSRTPDGLSHGNTLILRLKTVVVYLDIPHLPVDMPDTYRLISENGKYDRTLNRQDSVHLDEKRVALHFTEVYPFGTYSLYQLLTPEIELPVFLDVPFDDLPNYGNDSTTTEWKEAEKLVLDEPPKLTSEDPLAHPHYEDCKLNDANYLDLIAYRTEKSDEDTRIA